MKKRNFKPQLLLAGAIVLLFASCLGESENSRVAKGEFVYITSVSGTKVTASMSGYLTMDALTDYNLAIGDCALVDYKVSFEQGASGYTYSPEYLVVDPLNIFRARDQFLATESTAYPSEEVTKADAFEGITINAFSSDIYLGDRWLFEFDYQKYEGEEAPQLQVYYNQERQEASDLEKGVVTLDCVLSRMGGSAGATSSKTRMKSVVNFSDLRQILQSVAKEDADTPSIKVVKFKFRYLATTTATTNTNGYELKTSPLTNSYYLIYTE
jgi:hypothetical protein